MISVLWVDDYPFDVIMIKMSYEKVISFLHIYARKFRIAYLLEYQIKMSL